MIRYVQKNFDGKIIGSFAIPQLSIKTEPIDDQSEEYKEWEKSLEQKQPIRNGN